MGVHESDVSNNWIGFEVIFAEVYKNVSNFVFQSTISPRRHRSATHAVSAATNDCTKTKVNFFREDLPEIEASFVF